MSNLCLQMALFVESHVKWKPRKAKGNGYQVVLFVSSSAVRDYQSSTARDTGMFLVFSVQALISSALGYRVCSAPPLFTI